jgi:hypothetical protein
MTSHENSLRAYPNPANSQTTLELPATGDTHTITICNANGEEVLRIENYYSSQLILNTAGWTDGMYFVRVYTDSVISTGKLILIH